MIFFDALKEKVAFVHHSDHQHHHQIIFMCLWHIVRNYRYMEWNTIAKSITVLAFLSMCDTVKEWMI